MKKKVFALPIALLCLFGLVACDDSTSSSVSSSSASSSTSSTTSSITSSITSSTTSSTTSSSSESTVETNYTSVAINNKTELTAEWHANEADRELDIVISPEGNIDYLISKGVIVVTSSDTAVAVVSGSHIYPVGAGSVTITVTVNNPDDTTLSDSVELNILESLTEPDYIAATNIAEIINDTEHANKTVVYRLKTTVKSLGQYADDTSAGDYGNLHISDASYEDLLVYGSTVNASALTYSLATKEYTFSNPKNYQLNETTKNIKVGDELIAYVIRDEYKGTKQLNAVILAVNGTPVSNTQMTSDEFEGETEPDARYFHEVTGKITKIANTEYGNLYIKTEGSTKEVYVYGLTSTTTALTFDEATGLPAFDNPKDYSTNEATKNLKVGDTITVRGIYEKYKETRELMGILIPTVDKAEKATTISEIVEVGQEAEVTGVVAAKNSSALVISDGEASIYYYDRNVVGDFEVGDYVKASGSIGANNGVLQFSYNGSSIEKVQDGTAPTLPQATPLTAEIADGFATNPYSTTANKLYTWDTIIGEAGGYATYPIDGSDTVIEAPYSDWGEAGKKYTVTGYYVGYDTKNNYAVFVFTDAKAVTVNATAVELSGSSTVEVGAKTTLVATPTPAEATDTWTWTSSNPEIATVENGVVTGVKEGETTITVTSATTATVTDTFTVNVVPATVKETIASYDFVNYEGFTGSSSSYKTADLQKVFDDCIGDDQSNKATITDTDKISAGYKSSGDTGKTFYQFGLKAGTSSVNGYIDLSFANETVETVKIKAIGWKASDKLGVSTSGTPTNYTTISNMAYNDEGAALTELTFDISASNTVHIEFNIRGFIGAIEFIG